MGTKQMLLREGALKVFRRMAEEAESGSNDEALFSGLYRMASDLVEIIRKADSIDKRLRNVEDQTF